MRNFTPNILALIIFALISCRDKKAPGQKDIVAVQEKIDEHIENDIPQLLAFAEDNKAKLNDSITVHYLPITSQYYADSENKPVWSEDGKWKPYTEQFVQFIAGSSGYGLFPSDYYYKTLSDIRYRFAHDSSEARNAVSWGTADVLLTDAFFGICHDLKVGRLPGDSLSVKKDSLLTAEFYKGLLKQFLQSGDLKATVAPLEPTLPGYDSLKTGLAAFLDSVTFSPATYVNYPATDSLKLYKQLRQRFTELQLLPADTATLDSTAWKSVITNYQVSNNLKVTGKVNQTLVNRLNNTPWERFKQIAITLDKYKQLPDTLPSNYVWVNIPSFRMRVTDSDTTSFESRVVVGAPATRTPELYSEVSNFITYPQWTVPYSIIFKEMLPKIQKNVDYLRKQNLMVVDRYDSVIDPSTIDWSKLSKSYFPYLLKQRQGDDNSLGVIKFNFRNKYSVYLHDTNARGLFQRSARALSHGCVRVQQWQKFANYLIRNDTLRVSPDSLVNLIARKEKKVVQGFPRVPIFIRYFTCEGSNGRVVFFDDVYGTDKYLRERYFSNKSIINTP